MGTEIQAIMEAPVEKMHSLAADFVKRHEVAFAGEPGELCDYFNPVLNRVRELTFLDLASTREIYCAVAIFHEITWLMGISRQDHSVHALGWEALNKDVKNWCRRLLMAQVPRNGDHQLKVADFAAKGLLAHLLSEAVPQTPRDVLEVERALIPDVPYDA